MSKNTKSQIFQDIYKSPCTIRKQRNKVKKESHSSSDVLQRQHLKKNEKRIVLRLNYLCYVDGNESKHDWTHQTCLGLCLCHPFHMRRSIQQEQNFLMKDGIEQKIISLDDPQVLAVIWQRLHSQREWKNLSKSDLWQNVTLDSAHAEKWRHTVQISIVLALPFCWLEADKDLVYQ